MDTPGCCRRIQLTEFEDKATEMCVVLESELIGSGGELSLQGLLLVPGSHDVIRRRRMLPRRLGCPEDRRRTVFG